MECNVGKSSLPNMQAKDAYGFPTTFHYVRRYSSVYLATVVSTGAFKLEWLCRKVGKCESEPDVAYYPPSHLPHLFPDLVEQLLKFSLSTSSTLRFPFISSAVLHISVSS